MPDPSWFVDAQEALVMVFYPVLRGAAGVIVVGSALAALVSLLLDAVGILFKQS